jgi:glutathione S-transferase
MTPILYGSPISPFVRKVAIVLDEKGIAYEWRPTRPHEDTPEFLAISPLGKIPAYRDANIGISDSSVICQYIERAHPTPALYPTDTVDFIRALWWEEYFDDGLIVPMRNIFFQKWMYPVLLGKPGDEKLLSEGMTELPRMLAALEPQIPAQGWMVGGQFSIADISLAIGFANLGWAEYTLDSTQYPRLTAYVERACARPSFKKSLAFANEFITTLLSKKG